MIRTWRLQTLTGAAQPWCGDVLTAAFVLPVHHADGIVTVASTARYQVGDRIVLDPGLATADTVLVDRIFSATQLYVQSEGNRPLNAHASGALVSLTIACGDVVIQAGPSNAGNLVLGTDNTVTAASGGTAFYTMLPATVFRLAGSFSINNVRTSDGWMIGTAGDTVLVSFPIL